MIELSQHRGFEVMLTNDPALARAAAAAAKPANSKTEIIAKIDVVASLFPKCNLAGKGVISFRLLQSIKRDIERLN